MRPGKPERFSFSTVSEPIPVGNRTLRAVVRVKGWRAGASRTGDDVFTFTHRSGGAERATRYEGRRAGAAAWLRASPSEVIVREGDHDRPVRIVDPTFEALRGMALAGAAVGAAGLLVGAILRRAR